MCRFCFWDPSHALSPIAVLGRWDANGWFYVTLNTRADAERVMLASIPGSPAVTRIYVRSVTDDRDLIDEVRSRLNRFAASVGVDSAEVDYAD